MFGNKAKKAAIINILKLNNLTNLQEKNIHKVRQLGLVIKYQLLDDFCDYLKKQHDYYVIEFDKAKSITVQAVEDASRSEFKDIYILFENFLETEENFYIFLESKVILSLREKYGFNPLEDDDILQMAIEFEHGKDVKIQHHDFLLISPD
jgi:hypothetical protein